MRGLVITFKSAMLHCYIPKVSNFVTVGWWYTDIALLMRVIVYKYYMV